MTVIHRIVSVFLLSALMSFPVTGVVQAAAERFKPFVLASKGGGDFGAKVQETKDALKANGFQILGEYIPYENTFVDKAAVIIVTNDELKKVAGMSKHGGFAAPWRIALTQVGDEIQVSYPNPVYLAKAYRLKADLNGVAQALATAIGAEETFGSKRGLTARKLGRYHYTFGMEYFDDVWKLASYDSHRAAVAAMERNLANAVGGVTKVYRLDLPNEVTLFGVARKAPTEDDKYMDEGWIMNIVDFDKLKGTAYLPYEIMVDGSEVVALHMRFRMAVHYPDLKMMGKNSFMNVRPSPKAIQKTFTATAGGEK